MYTKVVVDRKTEQSSSEGRTNQPQKKPNVNKPAVRTTQISKMTEIFLTDPDSVTREEFLLFQSAIGYRQAVRLMEEGKRRKQLKKFGLPLVLNQNSSTQKSQQSNIVETLKNENKNTTSNIFLTVKQDNSATMQKNTSSNTTIRFKRGDGTNKLDTDESKTIMEIQKALEELRYLNTKGAYGYFGSKTEAAVNAFKNKFKLGNTGANEGVVGAQTLAKIQEELAKLKKSSGGSSSSSKSTSNGVEKIEHKTTESANSENDKKSIDTTNVKITYNTGANSSVISSYTTNFITSIAASSGNPNLLITSTIRTPEAQASAMYTNIVKNGVQSQLDLYGSSADKVIKVFQQEKALGKTKKEIIAAMTAKIKEVGSSKVSNHCYTEEEYKKMNTFDVRLKSLKNPNDFEKELKEAEKNGLIKYIRENDNGCFHIQVYQKKK